MTAERRILTRLVADWNQLPDAARMHRMAMAAHVVAKGQAIRASRALDRAMAEGGDVDGAIEDAKGAIRALLATAEVQL